MKIKITDVEGQRQFFDGIDKNGNMFTIRVNPYATVEVETKDISDSLQVGIDRSFVSVDFVDNKEPDFMVRSAEKNAEVNDASVVGGGEE